MEVSLTRFRRFGWLVVVVNLLVIVGGAVVRATGSGAGCGSHWPDCNGEIVPLEPTLETAIEFTHRTTSGLALILVVAQVAWAFQLFSLSRFPGPHPVRRSVLFGLLFIVIEALIGALLVRLELVGTNASMWRALIVGTHLVNTFLLVGALTLTPLLTTERHREPLRLRGMPMGTALWVAVGAMLVVGAAGAITALGDTLFPADSLAAGMAADTAHDAHPLVRLRVLHPLFAVVTYLYLVGASVLGPATVERAHAGARAALERPLRSLAALATAQIALGFLDMLLLAPLWLQMLHLLLADVVWMALVATIVAAARTAQSSTSPRAVSGGGA